jgi:hypothetical protein
MLGGSMLGGSMLGGSMLGGELAFCYAGGPSRAARWSASAGGQNWLSASGFWVRPYLAGGNRAG